jgi:hypothetical protein
LRRLRGLRRRKRRRRRGKKRVREREGVLGSQGVGMKEGVGGLPLGVPVIIVECMDILQEIVGWCRGKELRVSKVVVTPMENGDIPRGVAPTPLQEFQGGWEQGCSINIRDKV